MKMTDPKSMRRVVRRLQQMDDTIWHERVPGILRTALAAKFQQNATLKDDLMATGDTTLGEACPSDLLFGIGLSLNNPKSLNTTEWIGQNLHGQSLMEIRTSLMAIE